MKKLISEGPRNLKRFYSVKETAKLLGVSTNTVYKYIDEGQIAYKRIGKGRIKIPFKEPAPFIPQQTGYQEKAGTFKEDTSFIEEENNESIIGSEEPGIINRGNGDIIFYRLFKGLFIAGLGIIYAFIYKPYLVSSGLMDEANRDLLIYVLPPALIIAGVFGLYKVLKYPKLEKLDFWIHLFQSLILGYFCYISIISKNYGLLVFLTSLLYIITGHFIRGFSNQEKIKTFRNSYLNYLLILTIMGGLVIVFKPNLFPLAFLSEFIGNNQGLSAFMWFIVFIPILIYMISPNGKNAKNPHFFLIIGGIFALIIGKRLTIDSVWDVSYLSFLTGIFAIFLGIWQMLEFRIDIKKLFLISIAFYWLGTSLILGIFAIESYQNNLKTKLVSRLKNNTDRIATDIEKRFASEKYTLTMFATSQETKKVLINGNKEEASDTAKNIFDRSNTVYRVIIFNERGIALGTYPKNALIEGTDFSSRDYFVNTKSQYRNYFSSVFNDATGLNVVMQTEPVFSGNMFIGMIGVSYSVDQLTDIYESMVGPDYQVYALDKNGVYVISSESGSMAGLPGTASGASDNRELIDGREIRAINWEIYVKTSYANMFQDVSYVNVIISLVLVVNSLLTIFVGLNLASAENTNDRLEKTVKFPSVVRNVAGNL